MKGELILLLVAMTLALAVEGLAQSPGAIPVTPDNFPRAESDLYFGSVVHDGGLGKFVHRREPAAVDNQTVIR